MTWQEIARDPQPVMPFLKRRFRELSKRDLAMAGDKRRFAETMAARHDLTPREALDEVDDALMVAELNRNSH